MILTLEIDEVTSGIYRTQMAAAHGLVYEYSTIAEAIQKEALAAPLGFAYFMEVRYAGFSSGTELIKNVPAQAEAIAERLVALRAEADRLKYR